MILINSNASVYQLIYVCMSCVRMNWCKKTANSSISRLLFVFLFLISIFFLKFYMLFFVFLFCCVRISSFSSIPPSPSDHHVGVRFSALQIQFLHITGSKMRFKMTEVSEDEESDGKKRMIIKENGRAWKAIQVRKMKNKKETYRKPWSQWTSTETVYKSSTCYHK